MDKDTGAATTFGSRLAYWRKLRGLTQDELGKGLAPDGSDVSKAAISAWETDRNQPSAQLLRALCERLNVSANDLLDLRLQWDGTERRARPQP